MNLLRLGVTVVICLSSVALLASPERSPIDERIENASDLTPEVPRADQWVRDRKSAPYSPTDPSQASTNRRGFHVETRADKIGHAPCDTCHIEPKKTAKRATEADPTALAHGDLTLIHAPKERMICGTCHDYAHGMKPKTTTDVTLDFDRAYELCGGCHSRQHKDWRGGAHGKRLGNWMGTRIVLSCTGCHDPHRPKFQPRTPATYAAPPSTWEMFRP